MPGLSFSRLREEVPAGRMRAFAGRGDPYLIEKRRGLRPSLRNQRGLRLALGFAAAFFRPAASSARRNHGAISSAESNAASGTVQ